LKINNIKKIYRLFWELKFCITFTFSTQDPLIRSTPA
jgi:hypothetical protein